jgi:hypothetical protein
VEFRVVPRGNDSTGILGRNRKRAVNKRCRAYDFAR